MIEIPRQFQNKVKRAKRCTVETGNKGSVANLESNCGQTASCLALVISSGTFWRRNQLHIERLG